MGLRARRSGPNTILELCIVNADYTGKDLLKRCIILEGVIGIIEGMHPKLLKELLLCFLGESGHAIYEKEYEPREKAKLQTYIKDIDNKPAASSSAAELIELLQLLRDTVIKRFLQVINLDDLAKVISDLDGDLQIKLFNHLPERGAFLLLDAIEQLNSIKPQEIHEAHDKVITVIAELKDQNWTQ